MADEIVPAKPVKPGYKTSEFWLATAAMILSMLYASGIIETGSQYDQIAGMFGTILVSMGYSVSRGKAKE